MPEAPDYNLLLNEQGYLEDRLEGQLRYYSRKSAWNQKRYKLLKSLSIGMAVMIPFLSGQIDSCNEGLPIQWVIGAMGVLIALLEGIMTLYKFHDTWVEYRTTSELLKQEKMLYITRSGDYRHSNKDGRFHLFVERIESILATESNKWREKRNEAAAELTKKED